MHSQKMRLISLNLVLVMLLTMLPVQAADIVVDDDGPMYTVVLNGNGGTYEGDDTLTISYGSSTLYLEDYIFTREGYTLLGWSEKEDASTIDYTRFDKLYAFNAGKDRQTLYAVWGEGENCALYTDAIPNADYIQLGQYYVVNSETLPTVNESGFVAWYDHINGVYYAGDTVRAGEEYRPICTNMGNNIYPIILNGNGGKNKCGNELVFCGATNDWFAWPLDRSFKKDNYILNGWTNSPESDVFVDVNYHSVTFTDFTPVDGVVMLYAHWSPAYQLKDGAELVINGDTMNELLSMSSSSTGTGWRFTPGNSLNVYNQYGLSEHYSFGGIACNDGIAIHFDGDVSNGAIESGGMLGIFGDENTSLQISTHDTPAIQTSHLELSSEKMTYYLQTDEGVCVNASCICLSSPNITIVGNPAVRPDAQIISHNSGIGYTISEDKTTLTTFAIENKITLDGNGGTFDGQKTVDVDYDVSNKLDLSQYAFTREGYALIGWATDANGSNFVTEYDSEISGASYHELYAIWLKMSEKYAIFQTWNDATLANCIDSYSDGDRWRTYYSVALTDDFVIPSITQNGSKESTIWQNKANRNLYYGGEIYTPASGSMFRLETSSANLGNGCHTIVLDGNGGTYHYTSNSKTYNVNRQVVASGVSNGETVNYACNFTRPGYTLVSYNSEPDGSGTEYALNKCTVTADMDSIQILYAQWEEIGENGKYISIDGVKYDATQRWSGDGWTCEYWGGNPDCVDITLNGYNGGTIESNLTLLVRCNETRSTVRGRISAPELRIWSYTDLSVLPNDGAALISQGDMQIYVIDDGGLSATGAGGQPAVSACGEIFARLNGEGKLFAQGDSTSAISAESISVGDECNYLITAGTSSEDAAEVDRYTGQQYVSYKVRTKTLTLHGSGGTADGKGSISVDTKDSYLDLSQYANTFSNGGKVLLGWSRVENGTSVDYPNSSDAGFSFDSGISHADIYAVWDSNEQKGVVLNDYGQQFYDELNHYDGYNYFDQYTVVAAAGTQYTLPDSYKAGYRFLGWRSAQDGELYSAGTAITVEQSMTYTAEYEVLSMMINGKTYGMDKAHGSRSLGWEYRPAYEYGYWSGQVRLNIYENYSGKPVSIPSNAWLSLDGDITGENGQPAIYVDGNADISVVNGKTSTIRGCVNSPAVKVTGILSIDNLLYGPHYSKPTNIVFEGGDGKLSISAGKIQILAPFYAGNSAAEAQLVETYSNDHYVRIEAPITATVEPGKVLPKYPTTNNTLFVAWGIGGDNYRWNEYALPGDTNDSESTKTYEAIYIRSADGALILNGNGGVTTSGQKYYITTTSGTNLELTKDTVATAFHRDNYTLRGYSTDADGNGAKYSAEELASQLNGNNTVTGRVVTFFAQWTKTGDPDTPEKPSKPTTPTQPTTPPQTTTPDGSADITVSGSTVKVENVDVDKLVTDNGDKKTAEIDLSGTKSGITDVTLPTDAVKELAASEAESLTVKLPDVTVSFDDKALAAVAEQSSGADLSLSVNVGAANNSNLTDAQKNAITGARELSVIEVSLSSNGEKISNFNGGSVTIDVPFQWSMKGLLRAYYIDENGNKSAIDVTYKNGVATLVLNHFSTYVVEAVDALSFTDVSAKAYYFDAVAWAVKNKITSGQSDTLFAPDASCTRAQMVTFLWRANGSPEPTVTELPFIDVAADAYYAKAVLWAVENGITTGTSDTTFDPDGVVTRAEAVAFLWRAAGKPIAEGSLFADVESTKYYAEAVRWAVTSGITNGMSDSVFAPSSTCTRAQIVTFLYRTHRSK